LLHEYGHLYEYREFRFPRDQYYYNYERHLRSNQWTAMIEGFADFYYCLATLYTEYFNTNAYFGSDYGLGERNKDTVYWPNIEYGPEVIFSVVHLWWDLVDLDDDLPMPPPDSCGDGMDDYNGFSDRINMGYEYFFEVLDYLCELDEDSAFWDHPLEEMESYLISDFQYTGDADYYIQQVFEMNGMDWDPLDHDPSFNNVELIDPPDAISWRSPFNETFYLNYGPKRVWQDFDYTWQYREDYGDWINFGQNYSAVQLELESMPHNVQIKCRVESILTQEYDETIHGISARYPLLYNPENVSISSGAGGHVRISWDQVYTCSEFGGYFVTRQIVGEGLEIIISPEYIDTDILFFDDLDYYYAEDRFDPGAVLGDYRVYSFFSIDSLGSPVTPYEEPGPVTSWISTQPNGGGQGGMPKAASQKVEIIPENFALLKTFPNPFNATVNVPFAMPVDNKVNIAIFNIKGQKIITLADKEYQAGFHNLTWNSNSKEGFASSGIYFVVMKSSEFIDTQKILLIK